MKKNYMVGQVLKDGTKVKGFGKEGFEYFLDASAFYNKKGICYIDQSDCEYEYSDFLDLTNGNEELAKHYFEQLSGTSPELLLDEDLREDEVHLCSKCDEYYFSYEVDECPYCGELKKHIK